MGQLEELRSFARIAELESIGKAAELEGIAKSAMSRRLRLLEERLGVELVTRTTRNWSLTTEGEAYLARISGILEELDATDADIAGRVGELRGDIRISVPLHYGKVVLAPILVKFAETHPSLHLNVDFSDRFTDIIDEGYDFAIRIASLSDSTLKARKISETRHVFCASPGYLNSTPPITCPEDLKQHRILSIHRSKRLAWIFGDDGHRQRKVRLTAAMNLGDGDVLVQTAAQGFGVVRLPDFIVIDVMARGELIPVLEGWEPPAIPVHIVFPETRHLPARVRVLMDYLADQIAALRERDQTRSRD